MGHKNRRGVFILNTRLRPPQPPGDEPEHSQRSKRWPIDSVSSRLATRPKTFNTNSGDGDIYRRRRFDSARIGQGATNKKIGMSGGDKDGHDSAPFGQRPNRNTESAPAGGGRPQKSMWFGQRASGIVFTESSQWAVAIPSPFSSVGDRPKGTESAAAAAGGGRKVMCCFGQGPIKTTQNTEPAVEIISDFESRSVGAQSEHGIGGGGRRQFRAVRSATDKKYGIGGGNGKKNPLCGLVSDRSTDRPRQEIGGGGGRPQISRRYVGRRPSKNTRSQRSGDGRNSARFGSINELPEKKKKKSVEETAAIPRRLIAGLANSATHQVLTAAAAAAAAVTRTLPSPVARRGATSAAQQHYVRTYLYVYSGRLVRPG